LSKRVAPADTGVTIDLRGNRIPAWVKRALRQRAAFERAMAAKQQRAPVVHVPEQRENVATRPREQRPRRRVKANSRGDSDEPPPRPLIEIPPAEFRRQLRTLGVGV
jgi:hypothetical protein